MGKEWASMRHHGRHQGSGPVVGVDVALKSLFTAKSMRPSRLNPGIDDRY